MVVVVTQVSAHHHQGLGSTPNSVQQLRDCACRYRSDHEGQHVHPTEDELNEGELDLEAVFGDVRQVGDRYEPVLYDRIS